MRLTQGDYDRKRQYGVTSGDAAKAFLDAGCRYIHIVDLEGAETGRPCHLKELKEIASLGLFTQYGGGLRSADALGEALESGASRVMAGSLIFEHIEAAHELAARFGSRIMAAVDVKNNIVVHSGWRRSAGLSTDEAMSQLTAFGFTSFLVTLTEKDGMMRGTDPAFYKSIVRAGITVAAAGGITNEKDIAELAEAGADAAIIGKSLYEGGISVQDAIKAAGRQ